MKGIAIKVSKVEKNVLRTCFKCRKKIAVGQNSKRWTYYDRIKKKNVSVFTHLNCPQ